MYNFDNIREEIHFATTIMLVLTAILCLYTLFQSSLAGIPKTAYLKIIDYWNLLALSVTLINFFTLIIWEMFENRNYGTVHVFTQQFYTTHSWSTSSQKATFIATNYIKISSFYGLSHGTTLKKKVLFTVI